MNKNASAPAGTTREMTDAKELANHAIDRNDNFAGTTFFLVTWPDRSGWYSKAAGVDRFLVTVGNYSEEFDTAAAAEQALWENVEVTS